MNWFPTHLIQTSYPTAQFWTFEMLIFTLIRIKEWCTQVKSCVLVFSRSCRSMEDSMRREMTSSVWVSTESKSKSQIHYNSSQFHSLEENSRDEFLRMINWSNLIVGWWITWFLWSYSVRGISCANLLCIRFANELPKKLWPSNLICCELWFFFLCWEFIDWMMVFFFALNFIRCCFFQRCLRQHNSSIKITIECFLNTYHFVIFVQRQSKWNSQNEKTIWYAAVTTVLHH